MLKLIHDCIICQPITCYKFITDCYHLPDCLGRRLSPRLLGRGEDGSMVLTCALHFPLILSMFYLIFNRSLHWNVQRLVRDLYRMLDEINSEEVPVDLKVAESFDDFIWDTKNNDYDLKSFALRLKATVSIDAYKCCIVIT